MSNKEKPVKIDEIEDRFVIKFTPNEMYTALRETYGQLFPSGAILVKVNGGEHPSVEVKRIRKVDVQ